MSSLAQTFVIIGAGVAGLACARALVAGGCRVLVLDKGRGPGGRLSTRRVQTPLGEARFDHGAQFFTVRDPAFAAVVADLASRGLAARWSPRWAAGSDPGPDVRWTGTPGMNAIVRGLADGLDVRWSHRVMAVAAGAEGQGPLVTLEDASVLGPCRAVVVATPAEQAGALLRPLAPELADAADSVRSAPCWAAMAVFDAPVGAGFDVCRFRDGVLGLAARELSRPDRTGPERWVLHATPGWSADHLESGPEAAAAALVAAFRELTGAPRPVWQAAHRWRYAQVGPVADAGPGWSAPARAGACGDWRAGPRIEAAWQSGDALARVILAS